MEDLSCPITMDLLENPITLPCCGRAVSKIPMKQWVEMHSTCPLCRTDLAEDQIDNIPVSVNLAYLVESAKKNNSPNIEFQAKPSDQNNKLKLEIYRLSNANIADKKVIGQLSVSSSNAASSFKHLLLVVVDKSGSMSGNPTENVKYSLTKLIDATYKHQHLLTNIIYYNDRASSIEIDRKLSIASYQQGINSLVAGGGTSFSAAFNEISNVCKKNSTNPSISAISIIFLTDGEDSSIGQKDRPRLVSDLKTMLLGIIKVPYTVHTIGFGRSHDFEFLNKLKTIGTTEGAYRYADPDENTDILSSKINSILDVVTTSNVIPIKIVQSEIPIISQGLSSDKYWIDLTNLDLCTEYEFEISIGDEIQKVKSNIVVPEDDIQSTLWSEWHNYLTDQLADDVVGLSDSLDNKLTKSIVAELIKQRIKKISIRLEQSDPNNIRLEQLSLATDAIMAGEKIDKLKLCDIKAEGKFRTELKTSAPAPTKTTSVNVSKVQTVYTPKTNNWRTIDRYRIGKHKIDDEFSARMIYNKPNNEVCAWVSGCPMGEYLYVASSIGRVSLVETLLIMCCGIHWNFNGYNALDIAIIRGYWRTAEVLIKEGLNPNTDYKLLLCTCVSNKHYNTAQLLINKFGIKIDNDLVDSAPTAQAANWLGQFVSTTIPIEVAISKGMYDNVKGRLHEIQNMLSFKSFITEFLVKPTNEHITILELLLSNGKMDPFENFDFDYGDNEKGYAWPMFVAAKNGLDSVVDILLNYYDEASTLNLRNNMGTTALWIACCNKHIDIATKLLISGADPNIANTKGDSPLIPCIQKGSRNLVQLLLQSGAKLDVYNINRDNPIILCCRVGQVEILEMLLETLDREQQLDMLSQCADIDGFNPLIASAEVDKVACIKICIKYGADIEFRTSESNAILPGATALHIACFYGRFNSVRTLLELGANPITTTLVNNYNCLHIAIKSGHKDLVVYLMRMHPEYLTMFDANNRIPSFYAKTNEALQDLFVNKLANLLEQVILSDHTTELAVSNMLASKLESPGFGDSEEILDLTLFDLDPLTMAIISKKNVLAQLLINIHLKVDKPLDPISRVWDKLLNSNLLKSSPESESMLKLISAKETFNIQNKMLLSINMPGAYAGDSSLSPEKQVKLEASIPCSTGGQNLMDKMTNGFNINNQIKEDTIDTLKKSHSKNIILLGFLDKLRQQRIFDTPMSKKQLDWAIFEAKVHAVNMIACGESILEPIHLVTLHLYTNCPPLYQHINKCLVSFADNTFYHPFINCLYQALQLVPNHEGEVYRAVDSEFNPAEYAIGSRIQSKTFAMASGEWTKCTDLINNHHGMIFIIKSRTGKRIKPYSRNPSDDEVVFMPGTLFEVSHIYVGNIFVLGQANIRTTSYKASPINIERAARSEEAIIIELNEI